MMLSRTKMQAQHLVVPLRRPARHGRAAAGYTDAVMRVVRRNLAVGILSLAAAFAAGCERPLLSPDEDRSPFDRYDTVRNQHADQYIMDEFGHRRPNLRERLMPKE